MVKKRIGGNHGFEKFEKEEGKYKNKEEEAKLGYKFDAALLGIGVGMLEDQAETQRQQDEFKSQHVESLRDYNKPWEERTAIVAEWQSKGWGDTIPLDCPATFGPFQVSRWGGFGGCGFDIWFKDENGNKQKRWIDLDPTYNLVKDPIVNSISEQERTPECLFTIFPGGYYVSDSSDLVTPPVVQGEVKTAPEAAPTKLDVQYKPQVETAAAPGAAAAAGGAYRKTRRNRKTKRTNKRKSKRANKKTNKRRCKKTKKHQKK